MQYCAQTATEVKSFIMKNRETLKAHLTMVGVSIIWSFAFIAIKSLLKELDYISLNIFRFAFSTLAFIPFLVFYNRSYSMRISLRDLGILTILGAFSVLGYHLSLNYGAQFIPAGITSLLAGTSPLFTLILASLILRERATWTQLVGLALSFGGLAIVVLLGTDGGAGKGKWAGVFFVLFAALSWGAYTVGMKPLAGRLNALEITGYSTILGFLMMLPLINRDMFERLYALSPGNWLWLLFLSFVCTFLGYFLYMKSLEAIEATRVAAYLYAVPIFSLIWGALILNEPIRLIMPLGALVVIIGLALVEGGNKLTRKKLGSRQRDILHKR